MYRKFEITKADVLRMVRPRATIVRRKGDCCNIV